MSSYFKQSLQSGEEPLLLLRQHWATFVWPLVRTLLLVGISVPLMSYAFNYLWLTIVLIVWWVLVVVWALLSWFTWYFNITLVTSQRIIGIIQKGPFTRRVRETTYDRMGEVTFQIKGLLATIFGYGNVEVYFVGQDKPITIKAVSSPEIIKDQILKVQEFTKQKVQGEASDISMAKLAELIKDTKGEQKVSVHVKSNQGKDVFSG